MQKFVINTAHVSSEIFGEEAVIVNFMTGKYFGMTGSAPVIWKLFESPVSHDDVMASFSGLNGLSNEIKQQMQTFMDILLQENLIVDAGESDTGNPEPEAISLNSDVLQIPPIIEIFDDLQELIVLDPIHDADPEHGWPAQQRMIKP